VPTPNSWGFDLSDDDGEVAIASWPSSGCGGVGSAALIFVDTATGQSTGNVPLPNMSANVYTVRYL